VAFASGERSPGTLGTPPGSLAPADPSLTGPETVSPDTAALPSRPILSARGVRKSYQTGAGTVEALRGVDLDVAAGELVMVMGPSGNGKTTLLNCLSGLDDIDAGTVTIDGDDLHALTDAQRTAQRARRMGFVFQSFNLIPVFTAAENVELPLLCTGVRPREARERAHDMLERVGLGSRGKHRPLELSGGQQQRVAIARALVNEPAIVWADEPTGNLDTHTAADVLHLMREFHAGGQTLVVVTHDHQIGTSSERLVQVIDGLVNYDGHPDGAPPDPSFDS
jgi:putative ABC transport system ATP-binding protein